MQFDNLTDADLVMIEEGLRRIVSHRWEGMIRASQHRNHAEQEFCNREYEQAKSTYEKITGKSAVCR